MRYPSVTFAKSLPAVYGLMLACACMITAFFVYRNVYRIITLTERAQHIEQRASRERLNRALWDKVIIARVAKLTGDADNTETPDASYLRDPFQPW